jgi:hypothetical protein
MFFAGSGSPMKNSILQILEILELNTDIEQPFCQKSYLICLYFQDVKAKAIKTIGYHLIINPNKINMLLFWYL